MEKEYLTERTTVWRIEIDGQFLCKVYRKGNAEKIAAWLERHGITGRTAYKARPFMKKFYFASAVMGNRCPFDFLPWVSR